MPRRPRLLIYKEIFPFPPNTGAKLVTYNLILVLRRHFDITLVSLDRDVDPDGRREAEKVCEKVVTVRPSNLKSIAHRAFFRCWYTLKSATSGVLMTYYYSTVSPIPQTMAALQRERPFDVAFIECFNAAPLIDQVRNVPYRIHLLMDAWHVTERRKGEIMLPGPARDRQMAWVETIKKWEIRGCRPFDRILTVSKRDEEIFRVELPGKPVDCLPVIVDPNLYYRENAVPDPNRLLFLGAFAHLPNRDGILYFIEQVWPRIRERRPEARLNVAGVQMDDTIRKLDRVAGVVVHENVQDLSRLYHESAVSIAPLRIGSGIKVKVLEALSAGRAVVTTGVGAEGIAAGDQEGLFVRDDPQSFAEACIRLQEDPAYALESGKAGRRFIQENFSREAVADEVLRLFSR